MDMEYCCYSLKYDEQNDKLIISEYDGAIMPIHAAIDEDDICVSCSKENIKKIANLMFPGKEIVYYSWNDEDE